MREEQQLRINELAKKKKTVGLTEGEQLEQKELYRIYIDEMKQQVKISVENAGIPPKTHKCSDPACQGCHIDKHLNS